MFSEYASRIMHSSHLRFGEPQRARPLFHSSLDDRIERENDLALRQSRSRFGDRLGSIFGGGEELVEDDEDAHDNDMTLASSWRPPRQPHDLRKQPDQDESLSSSIVTDASLNSVALVDDAPSDIRFGAKQDLPHPPPQDTLESRSLPAAAQSSILATQLDTTVSTFRGHDRLYSILFAAFHAGAASAAIFLSLRSATPQSPWTKGIYGMLIRSSSGFFAASAIAILIAIFWLLALRVSLRTMLPVVMGFLPCILVFSSLAITFTSFSGERSHFVVQANAMRWSSLIMLVFAGRWCYTLYSRRRTLSSAGDIIQFACSILAQNSGLMLASAIHLISVLIYSIIWLHQFEILFLQDVTYGSAMRISAIAICQGVGLCILYLWTLGVLANFQRAWISVVVSQWYFHRHKLGEVRQRDAYTAAVKYVSSSSTGTICLASLLTLGTRLPLLILPQSLTTIVSLLGYLLFSSALQTLNDPLTMSLACIESCDLAHASQNIAHFRLLQHSSRPVGYTTAKMYLSATRATVAIASGSIIWLVRSDSAEGMYAYLAALLVATLTWTIVGSVEGLLSTIVDSALVCYCLDQRNVQNGSSHCEAANIFEDGRV